MTKRFLGTTLAVVLLYGCASEWSAQRAATPLTYDLLGDRAEDSVGNLRRLAILPARIYFVGAWSLWTQSEKIENGLAAEAASYLSENKGYETMLVADDSGAWRSDILATSALGSIQELKEAWERARTEEEIADAVRKIGRAFNVDGVVSLWTEKVGSSEPSLWSYPLAATWGMMNLFLLNAPLFYYMAHTNAEVVIYEASSGRPIWRNKLAGSDEPRTFATIVTTFFRNLENAIPAQLVR